MLQFEIDGKAVLDLFSGSGQMGLEAVSRGAAHAVLCDRAKDAVEVIRSNAIKTRLAPQCEMLCMDWEVVLRNFRRKRRFDLVFLDPPYAMGVIPDVLRKLRDGDLLSDGAKIVCESASDADVFGTDASLGSDFETVRTTRYGVAVVTVLQYQKRTEENT